MDQKPGILLDNFSSQITITIADSCRSELNIVGGFTDGKNKLESQREDLTWLYYGDPHNRNHEIFRNVGMIVSFENILHIKEIADLAKHNNKCLLCFSDDVKDRYNESLRRAAHYVPTMFCAIDKKQLLDCVDLIVQISKVLPKAEPSGAVYKRKDFSELN